MASPNKLAEELGIYEWINSLPKGLDKEHENKFAQVLDSVKKEKIIITSYMDNDSLKQINEIVF